MFFLNVQCLLGDGLVIGAVRVGWWHLSSLSSGKFFCALVTLGLEDVLGSSLLLPLVVCAPWFVLLHWTRFGSEYICEG